jgi:hypothetical protein
MFESVCKDLNEEKRSGTKVNLTKEQSRWLLAQRGRWEKNFMPDYQGYPYLTHLGHLLGDSAGAKYRQWKEKEQS